MAHLAIITTNLTGILHASFELVSRLEGLGHGITYMGPIDIKSKVESQGFTFLEIPEVNFNFRRLGSETRIKKGGFGGFSSWSMRKSRHYTENKKTLQLNMYEGILSKLKPDLVLVDEELHELILVAFKLGIQTRLLSQFFCLRRRPNLPPIRTFIMPGHGLKGSRLGIFFVWFYIKSRIVTRVLINTIAGNNGRRSTLLKFAKEVGFLPKHLISRNFPSVFIYRNLPIFSMTIRELEFPHNSPRNMNYLGAMVYANRKEMVEHAQDNRSLEKLFYEKKKKGKKLIYCSVGSLDKGDIELLKKVSKAVASESQWLLIISLGGNLSKEDLGPVSNNVHLFKWVPQLKVLEVADCNINHGGIHTINECIHFAVPMIVYSGKKYDQNGNAARMAYHGLGYMGDKDKDDWQAINVKIHSILEVQSFGIRIKEMRKAYCDYKKLNLATVLGLPQS